LEYVIFEALNLKTLKTVETDWDPEPQHP